MVKFVLNHSLLETEAPAGLLLLDFLRENKRLTGTKEGCREGDCGACMVLIGELHSDASIRYKPVTSCLMPLAECHKKHIVSVEGINHPDQLTPVQEAIVEFGGTQCGYCTPGIVVSLTALLLDPSKSITDDGVKYALSGNLCRCTGYRSLKATRPRLETVRKSTDLKDLIAEGVVPASFLTAPELLKSIPARSGSTDGVSARDSVYRIAGGTDLYVQQGEKIPDAEIDVLADRSDLKGITETDDAFICGALTTFEDFCTHSGLLSMLPGLDRWNLLMASWQIRNRATLGGNIVNASPIADMTSLLLALDAEIVLQDGSLHTRQIPLKSLFLDYKKLAKTPEELVTAVHVPKLVSGVKVNWEKVSKRECLDIATVNSGASLSVSDGIIQSATISLGGVAAIPLTLSKTPEFLIGKPMNPEVIAQAIEVMQSEFTPISDVRGTALYKRLLAQQFLIAHVTTLYPDLVQAEAFYASCR